MFCTQCGTPNNDDIPFCSNCGAPLKLQQKYPQKPPPKPQQPIHVTGDGPLDYFNNQAMPKNWMTEAILATVFGFLCAGCLGSVFGIVAIVFASSVEKKYKEGDIQGAISASKQAKTFTYISAGITLVIFVILVIVYGAIFITALSEGDF